MNQQLWLSTYLVLTNQRKLKMKKYQLSSNLLIKKSTELKQLIHTVRGLESVMGKYHYVFCLTQCVQRLDNFIQFLVCPTMHYSTIVQLSSCPQLFPKVHLVIALRIYNECFLTTVLSSYQKVYADVKNASESEPPQPFTRPSDLPPVLQQQGPQQLLPSQDSNFQIQNLKTIKKGMYTLLVLTNLIT